MNLARWIARHPARVLIAGLALALLALWPASTLRLETDLAALLPSGDRPPRTIASSSTLSAASKRSSCCSDPPKTRDGGR